MRDHGYVLIWVVLTIASLSWLAALAISQSRHLVANEFTQMIELRLSGAIRASIEDFKHLALGNGSTALMAPSGGTSKTENTTVAWSVSKEASRVDLNKGSALDLERLLASLSLPQTQARALARSIVDWRDSDGLDEKYPESEGRSTPGAAIEPGNRPFETVSELHLVSGVTADLYECLVGHVTLFGSSLRQASADPEPTPVSVGDVVRLEMTATDAGSGERRSEVWILRVTGRQQEPFWVLEIVPTTSIEAGEKKVSCT